MVLVAEHLRRDSGRDVLCELMMLLLLLLHVNVVGKRGQSGRGSSDWGKNADRGSLDIVNCGYGGHGNWFPLSRSDWSRCQCGIVGEDRAIGHGHRDQLWVKSGQDRRVEDGLLRVDNRPSGSWEHGIEGDRDDGLLWVHSSRSRRNESRSGQHSRFQEGGRWDLQDWTVQWVTWVVDVVRGH